MNSLKLCVMASAFLLGSFSCATATERATIIVAKDGTGNYTTIQAAINSVSSTNVTWVTILIKKGTYAEHVFIDKNYIALVGESRDSTIIQYDIDRDTWKSAHGKNNGSGVISIGASHTDSVTVVATNNTVIANLSVINSNTGTKYTHVIRGESSSTKISILYCNVWCSGEDTLALWDKAEGMYYQAYNSYKGTIDAVCPRGWCYDIGSSFGETATSCPIWLESNVAGQKFVIRRAYVTGLSKYSIRLINTQGSGAIFYLLDSHFSPKVSSQGVTSSDTIHVYYYNTKSDTTAYTWMANNIAESTSDSATAAWTFNNVWHPEDSLPAVLPFAAIPQPWDSAYSIPLLGISLKWIGARNADSYNVYLGATSSPALVSSQTTTSFSTGSLTAGQLYYWRVDAVTADSTIKGPLWKFVATTVTGTEQSEAVRPHEYSLYQNYPNPFNPSTTVTYELAKSGNVTLSIFDALGRNVGTLVNAWQEAGRHQVTLNAERLSAGCYYAVLRANAFSKSVKLLLLK